MKLISATGISLLVTGLMAGAAYGQSCQPSGSFESFKAGIAEEAAAAGVNASIIRRIVPSLSYSNSVIAADRKQGVFAQSFLQFSDRMVAPYRISGGRDRLKRHARIFQDVEAEYGVPGAVISAFWALETDFGAVLGNFNTLNALATLSYDCRRPELFRPQLIAALKLLDRGDLSAAQMQGAWAGELGQLQILPSDYLDNGVDYDRDGRVDLLKNTGDVLATGAKFLNHLGWRRGEPWLQEVAVPANLPWDQAGIYNKRPTTDWAAMGVKARNGPALDSNNLPSSLILPMGREGPAFLAYPNFSVFLEWNKSLVYTTSAGYLATRINGAPTLNRGKPEDILPIDQAKLLQTLLQDRGYDVGKIDGIIGSGTRAAVRDIQMKLGQPADAWPTRALLSDLQRNTGSALTPPPPPPLPKTRP
ncbi:lytic murein transglycosylase [Pararhizobium sp. IMCC21322]|uniref:lytic murein transglycosylase n=1 Tax=Pararhizobium sp. IMCC21322 TaxID=3067903 RepID=UPI002741BFE6|nr:lytic murein transglycosylase [Pararhizobium sp. IMCC21322]